MELGEGILVRPGHRHSETEIRHDLITPLLRRMAHSFSTLVPPEGCEGKVKTQENSHMPGEKTRVDYLLSGQVGKK